MPLSQPRGWAQGEKWGWEAVLRENPKPAGQTLQGNPERWVVIAAITGRPYR